MTIQSDSKNVDQQYETVTGVYMITCTINDRVYVGSARDINQRIAGHFSQLKAGTHDNADLFDDFRSYGETAFKYKIVERHQSVPDAKVAECRVISQMRLRCYNVVHGGHYTPQKDSAQYTTLRRGKNRRDHTESLRHWMKTNRKDVADLIGALGLERMRAYRIMAGTLPHVHEMQQIYDWTGGVVDANALCGIQFMQPSIKQVTA